MSLLVAQRAAPFRRFTTNSGVLLAAYAAIFTVAYFLAFLTRYDVKFDLYWIETFLMTVGGVVIVKAMIFYAIGSCHVSWKRVAFSDLLDLLRAATLSMLVIAAIDGLFLSSGRFAGVRHVPRGVILLDWAFTIIITGGIRSFYRGMREEWRLLFSPHKARSALVIGANQAGELLARNLMASAKNPYFIVGFLDDDPAVQNSRVAGIDVLGGVDRAGAEVARWQVDDVLVQSGTLTGRKFRRLLEDCTAAGAVVKVMPAIDELLGSSADEPNNLRLRLVEINDLLRREPVELDDSAVSRLVAGRTVLVSGAGGSIGSEICRQVLRYHPRRLVLVDRTENSLFLMEQELARISPRPPFDTFLADVGDEERMERIFAECRPDAIFHAAAHKHVPMLEANPAEAIKNNCLGTRVMARLADRNGVIEFVLISTDKAVHPTSVMGCSKLIAERYVQALSSDSKTKFLVVRFGNVLASSGSVVPIFQEQIRRGGPITVTHPDIERYFMTIPEAAQLVIQAAAMGVGGEVFVLDMGDPVKVVDLARDLVSLSGLDPDEIEIEFTGLRPGEKLHEELYFKDEQQLPTRHSKVFSAMHRPTELSDIEATLEALRGVLEESPERVRARLRELVPEYAG